MKDDIFEQIQLLDYLIFFIVLFVTVAVVIIGNRKKRSSEEQPHTSDALSLLLDGRRLTLPLFVATLVSTWYGGIFGVTQIAFEKGIYNFLTQGIFWYATYIIFALFLAEKVRKTEAKTLPELVGKKFGPKSEKVAAVFNVLNVVPVAYAMSLGIFIDAMFGTGIVYGTLSGMLAVVIYSSFGGFRAIVLSDVVQFFVMVVSVILVLIFSIANFGGMSFLQQNLPSSHFDWTGNVPWSTTIVWGIIALSTLIDPNFYQRVFAANSVPTAKKGILFSTLVWCIFDICTTAGAMYAAASMKGADSASAYLIHSLSVLPTGLKGFFLAGILATILSTLDSYLFIASSTITYDIAKTKRKLFAIHHINTLLIGLFAALLSFYFTGGIKDVWKTLGSYSAGCMLLPMLLGLWTRVKITDKMFLWSSLLAAVSITAWRSIERTGFWADFDDLYVGVLTTGVIILVALVKKKWMPKASI